MHLYACTYTYICIHTCMNTYLSSVHTKSCCSAHSIPPFRSSFNVFMFNFPKMLPSPCTNLNICHKYTTYVTHFPFHRLVAFTCDFHLMLRTFPFTDSAHSRVIFMFHLVYPCSILITYPHAHTHTHTIPQHAYTHKSSVCVCVHTQ